MSPRLLGLITAPLALGEAFPFAMSEAVELELVRVLGVTISSVASIYAAVLANRNRRATKEVRSELRRRRRVVRDGEHVVVVDEPGDDD